MDRQVTAGCTVGGCMFEIKTLDSECDIYWKQWTKYFRIQNNTNASFKQVMARNLK